MEPSIFISYCRRNAPIADRIHRDLKRAGCHVWRDLHNIAMDDRWRQSIRDAILANRRFLLLSSPEAARSDQVAEELKIAEGLPKAEKPAIGTVRVACQNDQEIPPDWRERQIVDMTRDYYSGLEKVLAWAEAPRQPLPNFQDLSRGALTYSEWAEELGEAKSWTVAGGRYVGLPILPSGYSHSWLVGSEADRWPETGDMQVLLKFSGPPGRDSASEVLEYLIANGQAVRIIYVEGPRDSTGGFSIPDDQPRWWEDAVQLIVKTVQHLARGRTCHFFFDSPQALVFPVAAKLREMAPYEVYNLNRNSGGDTSKRYLKVFEGRP